MTRSKHPNAHIESALRYAEHRGWLVGESTGAQAETSEEEGGQTMQAYEFTLRFALPVGVKHTDELIERLYEGGCDDSLIGIGHAGRIAFDFARGGQTAHDAIFSAIRDVLSAIPGAILIEVTPDLVGTTEVAQIVGCSRQNVRNLMLEYGSEAPAPLHEGNPTIWHLSPVLDWFKKDRKYDIDARLVELSQAAMRVNAAIDALKTDAATQREIHALFG